MQFEVRWVSLLDAGSTVGRDPDTRTAQPHINPSRPGTNLTQLLTPARPSPPSHGPPQGTAATAAQHLAVLGGGPSQTDRRPLTPQAYLRPRESEHA